jgi:hypothetical protein
MRLRYRHVQLACVALISSLGSATVAPAASRVHGGGCSFCSWECPSDLITECYSRGCGVGSPSCVWRGGSFECGYPPFNSMPYEINCNAM